MRSKKTVFQRIPNTNLFVFIIFLSFSKILIYLLIKNDYLNITLGGGNDADYYHAYAKGYTDIAVNIWPIILRYLNDFSLYTRESISITFLVSNLIVIPVLVANLSGLSFKYNQKYYLYVYLLCLMYPTLFFYTLDVYRDFFMVLVFIVGCWYVKKLASSSNVLSSTNYFFMSVFVGLFLLALRPYLGVAFLLSILLWRIKFNKKRVIFFSFLYLLLLFSFNYLGFFDSLTSYRAGFEDELEGGSNLGLDFSNPLLFIPNFIFSILGQLFGLYLSNPLAVLLLIIETIPLFFMMSYIIKNIRLADSFARFLIIFFILYASVWLIANDNLGTAVRLRLYNYLSVYICFFYILKIKKQNKRVGV